MLNASVKFDTPRRILMAFITMTLTLFAVDGKAAPKGVSTSRWQEASQPIERTKSPLSQSGDPRMHKKIRGLVLPIYFATISSRLQATILTIGPNNGERFKKGDSLIVFDCDIQKAELMRAEAQMRAAYDTYHVKLKLAQNGAISKLQPVLARADLKKAEAEHVLSAERVDNCAIKAPYDGRIKRRLANAHETVNFGDPLVEIVNDREVELQLYVPSNWLPHLKRGTSFDFHVDETSMTLKAEIIAIGAWIDNVSQLVEIRATCPKGSESLLAGMSGKAEFGDTK